MMEERRCCINGIKCRQYYIDCWSSNINLRTEKLPELGRAAGDTLKEFKNATKGLADDDKPEDKKDPQ